MKKMMIMMAVCLMAAMTFAVRGSFASMPTSDDVSKLLSAGSCGRSFTNCVGASWSWANALANELKNRYEWAEERSEDHSKFRQGYYSWTLDLSPDFKKGSLSPEYCTLMSGDNQYIEFSRAPFITVSARHNAGQYYYGWIGEHAGGNFRNITLDGIAVDWVHTTSSKICWVTNSENFVSSHIRKKGLPVEYMILDLSAPSHGVIRMAHEVSLTDDDRKTRIVLKRVTPGRYVMGSPKDEVGRYQGTDPKWKEDQREVVITNSFYLGIFEITRGQWHLLCGNVPKAYVVFTQMGNWQKDGKDWELRPVLADAFSTGFYFMRKEYERGMRGSFIGKLQERFPCLDITLPNEMEWEYACRAGTSGAYGVVEENTGRRMGCFTGKNYGNPEGAPIVGSFPPNAWGFYDMNGSLPEWCSDCDDYGYQVVRGRDRSAGRDVINRGTEGGDMCAGFRIKVKDWFNPESECDRK